MSKAKYCEMTLTNGKGEMFYCVRVETQNGLDDYITSNVQEHFKTVEHYSSFAERVSEL